MLNVPGEDLPHVTHFYKEAHPLLPAARGDRRRQELRGRSRARDPSRRRARHDGASRRRVRRFGEVLGQARHREPRQGRIDRRRTSMRTSWRFAPTKSCSIPARRIPAEAVLLLTGYRADPEFMRRIGVEINDDTLAPKYNVDTYETNVPGLVRGGRPGGGIAHRHGVHRERPLSRRADRQGDRRALAMTQATRRAWTGMRGPGIGMRRARDRGPARSSPVADIQILGFNDFHGALEPPTGSNGRIGTVAAGGVEYLAAHIARLKAENPNTIVVSAGDNIGASSLLSGMFHDEPTIEALSAAGLRRIRRRQSRVRRRLGRARHACRRAGVIRWTAARIDTPFSGARYEYLAANVRRGGAGAVSRHHGEESLTASRLDSSAWRCEGTPSIVCAAFVRG